MQSGQLKQVEDCREELFDVVTFSVCKQYEDSTDKFKENAQCWILGIVLRYSWGSKGTHKSTWEPVNRMYTKRKNLHGGDKQDK